MILVRPMDLSFIEKWSDDVLHFNGSLQKVTKIWLLVVVFKYYGLHCLVFSIVMVLTCTNHIHPYVCLVTYPCICFSTVLNIHKLPALHVECHMMYFTVRLKFILLYHWQSLATTITSVVWYLTICDYLCISCVWC